MTLSSAGYDGVSGEKGTSGVNGLAGRPGTPGERGSDGISGEVGLRLLLNIHLLRTTYARPGDTFFWGISLCRTAVHGPTDHQKICLQ